MDLGLKDKTALVTGGGRGIGRAIALALAREGVHVAIASRNPEMETVEEIKALGVKALRLCVDVSDEKQVVDMIAQAISTFGHLDMYVNNSGNHWHEPVTKMTTENFMKTINTNLAACIWACREVTRHMIARGGGSILIVDSTIQFMPGYKESSYRITKVGLKAYAETMALELGRYHVRVNLLSPGLFPTELAKNLKATVADPVQGPALLNAVPMGRLGDAEECGDAAAMLLSDKVSSYITAADLVIDGGFRLRPLVLVTPAEIASMNQ